MLDQMNLLFDSPYYGVPEYEELRSTEELHDPQRVLEQLKKIDWAFTEDDTSYLSHDIHPYPSKFIPQIPGHLIARLSQRGELVLDPFGGSGTAALEAARLGRRAISIDANPIGTLIGRVKTLRPNEAALADVWGLAASLKKTRLFILPSLPEGLFHEFKAFVPDIPNIEKWFACTACGELAIVRSCIEKLESPVARDIASLALSRCIIKVSFQDSETRYASKIRDIPMGFTIQHFLKDLNYIVDKVLQTAPELQYGVVDFVTADTRFLDHDRFPDCSVDLIVTSPPYGNANDYHLYHRFRMFWLGFDPRDLARIEIGSHLRHQRESSGFEGYINDMKPCITEMFRLLKPGRYAAFIIGDPVYYGQRYNGFKAISKLATNSGFEVIGTIERFIHRTKRSFVAPGRRAEKENIVLLKKPSKRYFILLNPPSYNMWEYEELLRVREAQRLLGQYDGDARGILKLECDPYETPKARRLVFSRSVNYEGGYEEKTWQGILENGLTGDESLRKDPKYVTHGLHSYKGKFYPQLAKGLINITGLPEGSVVLDPFCGSGTTLLECRLNGLKAFGCDLHPLASKIAKAKIGILDVSPRLTLEVTSALDSKLTAQPKSFLAEIEQFQEDTLEEIERWFPRPVIYKLNWILRVLRSVSSGILKDFFEVILSSIIREVSQQDPSDLRIRRRKELLCDADVISVFRERLHAQIARLEKFWAIRGYCPYHLYPATVLEGDSRIPSTFQKLGLKKGEVDLILTSPPYATALPYIDTDRLSLLILFGMTSRRRRPLEEKLTGSREISKRRRLALEANIESRKNPGLPQPITEFIHSLYLANLKGNVGFRRQNLSALLTRFFSDIQRVLINCKTLLKPGGEAIIVIGDNTTMVNSQRLRIPTTDFIETLGDHLGLRCIEKIPITVTKENLRHIRHAITQNIVLRMRNP